MTEVPIRHEIVPGRSADGTPWWSVVRYHGDTCVGGDHHWLSRAKAVEAMTKYEAGATFPLSTEGV